MYKIVVKQTMDLAADRQIVARALKALEEAIARLVEKLAHGNAAVTLEPTADSRSSIRRACDAYSAIDYGMEDEVGSSVVCLGAVGVNSEVLKRAQAVNARKAEFKQLCAPLHGIRIRVPVKGQSRPTAALSAMRVILRNIQRSDLNLLAAYRKIPILDAPPASITYTRANTRAVYRKAVDAVYALLNDLEGPDAASDRARIDTLDRRETHLALVKEHYQNVRANVLYKRLDTRGRGRIQISAELPLMYPQGRHTEPEINFPAPDGLPSKPTRQRKAQIEPAPFLQCLPIYRYNR